MTPDDPRINLAAELLPIACELVACVRDYGPEVVASVLARVPDGRHDALAVVLAAMVDPDARPKQLLAWIEMGPVPSRTWEAPSLRPDAARRLCDDCGELVRIGHMARHNGRHHRRSQVGTEVGTGSCLTSDQTLDSGAQIDRPPGPAVGSCRRVRGPSQLGGAD